MWGFLRACLAGMATAMVMVALASLPFAMMQNEPVGMILVGFVTMLPVVAIFALVLIVPSALLIGLPVTIMLARAGRESAWAYAAIGGGAGAAVPLLLSFVTGDTDDSVRLAAPALLSLCAGMATGRTWWRYRRTIVTARDVRSVDPRTR